MLEQAGAFEPAYEAAVEAVNRNPGDARALASVVESAVATGRQTQAVALLKGIIQRDLADTSRHASRFTPPCGNGSAR